MQAGFFHRTRLVLSLMLGLAVAVAFGVAAPRAALADAPWGPGVRVNDDDTLTQQDHPATALASTGDVYAVWADYRDSVDFATVYFARSADSGQTWSANVPITTGLPVNGDGFPAVAASGPLDVHVVWGSSPVGYQYVYYSGSGDGGQTWDAPWRLDGTEPMAAAIDPDVATDGVANVYVVWSEYTSLKLAHSADGGGVWPVTPALVLTSTYALRHPALTVDMNGVLHLVWDESAAAVGSSVICYARSEDHGVSWTPAQCFGKHAAGTIQELPDIAASPVNGALHIVWQQNFGNGFEIQHIASPDGGIGWGAQHTLSTGLGTTWPAVAVQTLGDVYVVWEQGIDVPDVMYTRSEDGGGTWSAPGRVNEDAGYTHRYPAIAAAAAVHVLWTFYDQQDPGDIHATAFQTQSPISIPLTESKMTLDGQCMRTEYSGAAILSFSDFGLTGTVRLQHDGQSLYICMDAIHGYYDQDRAAAVYLDTDAAREIKADADDFALKVTYVDGTLGQQSSWYGSGNPANPYSYTEALLGWTGVATYTGVVGEGSDYAEYRIPMTLTGGLCGSPFGLAVYHQGYQSVYFAPYGWPSNHFYDEPHTWQTAYYAGAPCPEPAELPVFTLLPPNTTPGDALEIGGALEGITGTDVITGDSYTGGSRWIIPGAGNGTQFELFGASGGFQVSNPGQAFGNEAPMDPNAGNPAQLACQFLLLNGLFTSQTPAPAQDCNNPLTLGYNVIQILSQQHTVLTRQSDLQTAAAQTQTIGVMVEVPVGVAVDTFSVPAVTNASQFNPQPEPPGYPIPFDGPGGHLSLIFSSLDPAGGVPSLDSSVPGLGAIAAPSFGRRMQPMGQFQIMSRAEATQQAIQHIRASIQGAEEVNAGPPELVYYLNDIASPQSLLIPMWAFHDATAQVDGETLFVRGFYEPAVAGLTPLVTITAPLEGTPYLSGQSLTLMADVTSGSGPYTYSLALDDGTVLREGVTNGSLTLTNLVITQVMRNGEAVSVTLRLDATDVNGVSGWTMVNLQPIIFHVYLPLVLRDGGAGRMMVSGLRPLAPQANYDVGIEYISDYLPLGPGGSDIPNTVPDAIGFYDQLRAYGWGHAFKYGQTSAWEKDWRDCTLGGIDCSYGVERAEFAYFTGHGSPARIYFSSNKDSSNFWGGNARFQNVRWAGFSSCQTLRAGPYIGPGNPPLTDWFNAFQGAHMLLGFHSNMADIAFGGPLGYNMREHCFLWWCSQLTIREAWVKTAFDMNAGKPAYLYAIGTNGVNPVDNKLPTGGAGLMSRPFPAASYHWVWWE